MIHLLWCTIRPQVFVVAHKIWLEKANSTDGIISRVCVNSEEDKIFIQEYDPKLQVIVSDKPDRIGVCYPAWLLSSTVSGEDEDIVVFASDDFLPPDGWDDYITGKLANNHKVLMVRDGYQFPDSSNMIHPAVTIPIMTIGALRMMNGIIYHPAYHHMFSDCELYLTAKELNILMDDRLVDATQFTHHHYAYGMRSPDAFDVQYNNKWIDDQEKWQQRSNMNVMDRLYVKN